MTVKTDTIFGRSTPSDLIPPSPLPKVGRLLSPKKSQSEPLPSPSQMSMTIDLPQCQEQRRGGEGAKKMSV